MTTDKWQQLKERREIELQEAVKLFDEAEKIRNPEKYKKDKSRKRHEVLYLSLAGLFIILIAVVSFSALSHIYMNLMQ